VSTGEFIYAIGAEGSPHVKIGKTAGPVAKRVAELQIGQSVPLKVLASVPVEQDISRIEKAIHRFLEANRQRGEWFTAQVDQGRLEALIVRAMETLGQQLQAPSATDVRTMRETVGNRIVLLRRRKRLSQPELAQQAGMSVTTLNRVENAHQSLYMEKVAALAKALGTSTDYLLGMTDDMASDPQPPKRRRKADKQGDLWPAADALVGA
jgi:transcriptional regulator with XRE-family HTH domain